jgi:hypothetical protein
MRMRWKILSGCGVVCICTFAIVVGQTGVVQGDTAASPPRSVAPVQNPNEPYPQGPGAIPYEQLGATDKLAVDQIQETTDTRQPPSSYQGWAAATAWTRQQAEAEIASRSVGLVGAANEGVVP